MYLTYDDFNYLLRKCNYDQWHFYEPKQQTVLIRVRISGSHFAKCEGVISFCEALSQRKNKNKKLSIHFLVSKFHLVTILFKKDNVLQKNFISWRDLILQPPHQVNFHAVYLTSFMFYVLSFLYFSLTLLCTAK